MRGRWAYLYGTVDRAGQTVDFRKSARRDLNEVSQVFDDRSVVFYGSRPSAFISRTARCDVGVAIKRGGLRRVASALWRTASKPTVANVWKWARL